MSKLSQQEHFAKMIRNTMEAPAWRGLSSTAQALYPWLKLQWKGTQSNNNGKIRLSVRQAAELLGVSISTASRAFHDLQAKGFVHVTEAARLGLGGDAKSPTLELTELAMPSADKKLPRKLYLTWSKGNDFPVHKTMAHNPNGRNGKEKNLSSNSGQNVINMRTGTP